MRFVVIADDGFGEGFLYVKGGVGSEPHFSKDESEALVFASRLQAEAVMYWLIVRNAAGVPDYDECSKGNFWVGDLDDPRD